MKQPLKFSAFVFTLAAIFIISPSAFSQSAIKTADISIARGKSRLVGLDCSQQSLVLAFGKPTQMKNYNFEMDNKMGNAVLYNGANFYFEDNKLIGFEISKPGFNLTFGHPKLTSTIGRSIASLPPGFTTKCRGNNCAKVYDLKNTDNSTTDKFLEYQYSNGSSKLTMKIILGEY